MMSDGEKRPIVVGFGECLWDVFDGTSSFGGAPANFACHAAALGAQACLVSAVGDDPAGSEALRLLRENDVGVEAVGVIEGVPTGVVLVSLDERGHPSYTIREGVAWDRIGWSPAVEDLAMRADAVCFGTLAQRSRVTRETLWRFLEATAPGALRVFDVNLRGDFYTREVVEESLRRASVLKMSDEELPVLAAMFGLRGATPGDRMKELRAAFELKWVILTCGSRGAMLLGEEEEFSAEARPVRVCDTVGAGDSFTATVTVGLLRGSPVQALIAHACRVAEHVCSQPGAVPVLPALLRSLPAAQLVEGR